MKITKGPAKESIESFAALKDVTVAAECPHPGASAASDMAAPAAAIIPIKVGLTLSHTWKANEGD